MATNITLTPYTTSCPLPDNLTPLSPNGFMLSIAKLPSVSFFAQSAEIPSLDLPAPVQHTPLSQNVMAGDYLSYGDFQMQFLIDDKMENYKAIHNWMIGLGFPESYEQYANYRNTSAFSDLSELKKNFSDGVLQILSGTNTVVQSIEFLDMYPTSLQSLQFQTTNTDVQYMVGTVTFKYDIYRFI